MYGLDEIPIGDPPMIFSCDELVKCNQNQNTEIKKKIILSI